MGCIEGFEICKKLVTPQEFETELRNRRAKELEIGNPRTYKEETYWKYRMTTVQIEYVFEVLKVAWNKIGTTNYPSLRNRAIMHYTELLGISKDKKEGYQFPKDIVKNNRPMFRKLKRDTVITMSEYGDLVGIYLEDDKNNVLIECSPEKADKIIEAWNKEELSMLPFWGRASRKSF